MDRRSLLATVSAIVVAGCADTGATETDDGTSSDDAKLDASSESSPDSPSSESPSTDESKPQLVSVHEWDSGTASGEYSEPWHYRAVRLSSPVETDDPILSGSIVGVYQNGERGSPAKPADLEKYPDRVQDSYLPETLYDEYGDLTVDSLDGWIYFHPDDEDARLTALDVRDPRSGEWIRYRRDE